MYGENIGHLRHALGVLARDTASSNDSAARAPTLSLRPRPSRNEGNWANRSAATGSAS